METAHEFRRIPPPRPLTIGLKPSDDETHSLRRPAAATIFQALLLALLMVAFPHASLAASGGRMGGSNFSSYPSSSQSSSSYSTSSSRSSSSYWSSSDSSSWYSSSSDSSPSSTTISNTYSVSQDSPRPMTAGDKACYTYSVSQEPPRPMTQEPPRPMTAGDKACYAYSVSQETPRPMTQEPPRPMTAGDKARYTYSVSQEPPRPRPTTAGEKAFLYCCLGAFVVTAFVVIAIVWSVVERMREAAGPGITIHKIQVGLMGMARRLQKDLDHIAETVDTSTSEGLHYMLTETALALLRDPDSCVYAYSYVDVKRTREDGEKEFGHLSIEERAKFDEETLVNSNNIKRRKTTSRGSKGVKNDYIVVTILLAAVGKHKLPAINGVADLKEALQSLGSIPPSETLAVEVLWTPQKENDTLSERELFIDYPLLRPL